MTEAKTATQKINIIGPSDTFDIQVLAKYKANDFVDAVKKASETHMNLKCGLIGAYATVWIKATNDIASQMRELTSYKLTVSISRYVNDKGLNYRVGEVLIFKPLS